MNYKDGKIEYTLQDAMDYYGINEKIYEIILEKALINYFNDIKNDNN